MLPQLLPMLAVAAEPFDDPEHRFEIKWDGVRALCAVEANGWRLWGRERSDYTGRYPELDFVRRLPPDTLLDGELVALRQGLPNLAWLLRRHHLANPWQVRWAWRWCPVRYVLFDVLYWAGHSLLAEPFHKRHELLAEIGDRLQAPEVLPAAGVVGAGQAFFAQAVAEGHEGVMAKHLGAPYRAGRRSPAWKKIKPRRRRDPHDSARNCLDVGGDRR
jgi:bifunctional non-homologous end joining protein LigD